MSVSCPGCGSEVRVVSEDGCVDCSTASVLRFAATIGWKSTDSEVAGMIETMKARGARYPGSNFYGIVHETAHGFDLGLSDADPEAINRALRLRSEYERLQAEVVAKAVSRWVSAYVGFPLFPDSVRYAAASVKKFAERDGTKVSWTPDDFVDETVRLHRSERVERVLAEVSKVLFGVAANEGEMPETPSHPPRATVEKVEIFYNLLDGGPIACPHCGYITRPDVSHCPSCGCPMRLRGKEIRYPDIYKDYRESRKDS